MNSRVDLHMHSECSDGSDGIPALLQKIRQLDIRTFAVTDHDTIKGALEMERLVPEPARFIRGIEMSCYTPIAKCHILGYQFDPENKNFRGFLEELHRIRKKKLYNRLKYLKKTFGFCFSEEEIAGLERSESSGKPALEKLVRKQLPPPEPGKVPVNIYETYFKDLPKGRIEADRAIQAVREAGGITVWAHPLGGTGEKRLTAEKFRAQLEELCKEGIQGLECYYAEYTPEETETLCRAARSAGLAISGGSDYHGTNKPHLHLGMLNKDDRIVREEQLTVLAMLP